MTSLARIAAVKADIARWEGEGISHVEEDGRLARLLGKDLYWDNPYWEAGDVYADQPRAAQEFYDGWVAENLALNRSAAINRMKVA